MKVRNVVPGVAFLALSLVSYFVLGFYALKYGLPSDISWFHIYVVKYAGYPLDRGLSVVAPVDLRYYDTLGDLLIRVLARSSVDVVPLVAGALTLVLVVALTYFWSRDLLAAGLAALLVATTPGFVYWFKLGMFGPWNMVPLTLLGALLLFAASGTGSRLVGVLAGAVLAFSWLLNGSVWVVVASYGIAASILVTAGKMGWRELVPARVVLVVFLVAVLLGYRFVTLWHAVALGLLAGPLVGWYLVKRFGLNKASSRLVAVVASLVLAAASSVLASASLGAPGVTGVYYKQYNPMFDLGAPGLLLALGFLALSRTARYSGIVDLFAKVFLLSTSVTSLLLGYVDVVNELYAIVASSVVVAYVLTRVLHGISVFEKGFGRATSILLVSLVLLSIVGSNAVSSTAVSWSPPSIVSLDIPLTYINRTGVDLSGLPSLLSALSNVSSNRTLVVAYWGYTYYILGYLGEGYTALAGPSGPVEGWRLASWIMVSDEATAAGILRRLAMAYNISRVYVIVGEAVSIENTVYGTKQAHFGRAIPAGGIGTVTYQPLGDVARIPVYAALANQSVTDFVDYSKATYFVNVPLAWTSRAASSLVVELVAYAAHSMGYPVLNDVYQPQELSVEAPMFFRLVNTTLIPLDTTTSTSATFYNYYLLALYEFREVAV
ncbi:hypothetical protein [Thermogladius sp.]|uniref:hypothetical protein n=1 Tax=Thermogladius sp. TaxID=2023064 RepID=UPI003D1145DD